MQISCGGQGSAAVALFQEAFPELQPTEPWAVTEGTLQVIQQHGEGMAVPVLLIATGSTKETQTATARTAYPGGPVREVVLEVTMVVCLPAPHSELLLPGR